MKISKQDVARSGGFMRTSIGARLRELRQEKGLSQADLQERTGVHRCYISRIEHGPTVPSLETLEKFAAALDLPLYRIFYGSKEPPPLASVESTSAIRDRIEAEPGGPDASFLRELRELWNRMGQHEREVLMGVAKRLASRELQPGAEGDQVGRSLNQAQSNLSPRRNGQTRADQKPVFSKIRN